LGFSETAGIDRCLTCVGLTVQTRAYSICRKCAAVFPDGRRCPRCDGDQVAARAIAEATAHAIEQAAPTPSPRRNQATIAAAAMLALILALGAAVAAIASPSGYEVQRSGSGSASQVHE
jgi:hypothetical protein